MHALVKSGFLIKLFSKSGSLIFRTETSHKNSTFSGIRLTANTSILIIAISWLGHSTLRSEELAIDPPLRQAASNFTTFISTQLKTATDTLLFPPILDKAGLKEGEKLCESLVHAANKRTDIAEAARLEFEAYRYAIENLPLKKEIRKPPQNKALATLLTNNEAGITEGQIIKCLSVTHLRLCKFFTNPAITEKQIMDGSDLDLWDGKPLPGPNQAPPNLEKVDDVTLEVADDGTMSIAGNKIHEGDLLDSLKKQKQKTESTGTTLRLTLKAGEKCKYENVVKVLDAAKSAGIDNLTFQADASK